MFVAGGDLADWEYCTVIQVYWAEGRIVISLFTLFAIPAGVRTGHVEDNQKFFLCLLQAVKSQSEGGGVAIFFL